MSDIKNFQGILILPAKDKRPTSRTMADLRNAGYIVLFLECPSAYRIETEHISLNVEGNARLLLKAFNDANRLTYKSDILKEFGAMIAELAAKAAPCD